MLNSEYHMSFVEIGCFFDREWKSFKANRVIDIDTLLCMTKIVRTRNLAEAMALNSIVEDIMNSDEGFHSLF